VKIAVVGAGATGLTAGYELARRGHRVTLFERSAEIGGLVQTLRIGNRRLEKTYHHLFTSDTDFIDLADELGLGAALRWISPRNGLYINHTLYPFTTPRDLLFFRELSVRDRLAMGWLILKARRVRDWRPLENIPARDWVVRSAGSAVWEKFWRPLLAAKFDRDADQVAAAWLWNKIKLRGSTRGKNPSREMLGYMDGSFGVFYDVLARRITEQGGRILCGREVKGIHPRDDGTLTVDDERFDAVLATVAPRLFAGMTPALPEAYRGRLEQVRHKANLCMILELPRPLSPYYWTSVAQCDFPFVAVIEHTNLLPAADYGAHVVYLSRYIDERDELYLDSDVQVRDVFLYSLKRMFPDFDRASMINAYVFRSRFAQPVITTGYAAIRPAVKTPIRNLYLGCMAQIFPEDRGQNYAVRLGRQAAELIHDAT
jgi:protoporphyrinogen oxidase